MFKAIIFDFFDVIRSDPYKAWLKNHGFEREGGFLEVSQKLDHGHINTEQFFKTLSALSGQSPEEIEEEHGKVAKIDFKVLSMIEYLKKTYKIGLLSNAPSQFIREILSKNDLEKYFDEIVVSSEVGHIKPSKEIFDIMLDRLKTEASEALFIDDSKHHTDGAERAGIKSIVFESASQLQKELEALGINCN